ncbi:MFS domain-containing protein [Mycena indigotica]|uniref:MFS domain-containing protein n=1 Tax=Mycena indigotica TaxID=2126181 RepID=A0A8H6RXJ2_9AGAR|nr:MFS domain-containing protein [Mycena indigotica]KAF7289144.1 MFS domain-containing protein [Mycena indigotica]
MLEEEDKYHIRRETAHKYSQTWRLYYMVIMSSLAAAVQGMDESVINGAQILYPQQFGIGSNSQHDSWLVGLVNSAPYLCCALISCWLTDPLNKALGRKRTIFFTCAISFVTSTYLHMECGHQLEYMVAPFHCAICAWLWHWSKGNLFP